MRSKGFAIEDAAEDYLRARGLTPLDKNFAGRRGEVDLIMKHDQEIVFIEVRYRKNLDYGLPEETVGKQKIKKLVFTAKQFLSKHNLWDTPCRFDVIAVTSIGSPSKLQYRWINNAFSADGT